MFQNSTTRHTNANSAGLFRGGETIAHHDTNGAEMQPDTATTARAIIVGFCMGAALGIIALGSLGFWLGWWK